MIEWKPSQPRWRQVHAVMRERIHSGQYQPGERIPSLIDLVEEFGIANATAQKVMRALRADGMITLSQAWDRSSLSQTRLSRPRPSKPSRDDVN